MIIRSSKRSSGRRFLPRTAALAVLCLAVALAGCAAFMPNTKFERDIPPALQAADIGIVQVDISSRLDGFTKYLYVDCRFENDALTVDQVKETLVIVQQKLGTPKIERVRIEFSDVHGERLNIDAPVDALNSELGLSDSEVLDGEGGSLAFSPVELKNLVENGLR